jgi:3-dehydroquinate dehydratase
VAAAAAAVITGAGGDGYVMALQTAVRLARGATTETEP